MKHIGSIMRRILFLVPATIVAVFILLIAFWHVGVPESLLVERLTEAAATRDFTVTIEGFRKGFFPGITAEKVTLARTADSSPIVSAENVRGAVPVMSLFHLAPEFVFTMSVAGGAARGAAGLAGAGTITVDAEGIRLGMIRFPQTFGTEGDGILSLRYRGTPESGEVKFEVREARLSNKALGAFVPLSLFPVIRGFLLFDRVSVKVQSLVFEGKDAYARIKGSAQGQTYDLVMEVMIEPSFQMDPILQRLMEKYRVTPGYYSIPLRGTR